jgi:VCBS repeat-containing protein
LNRKFFAIVTTLLIASTFGCTKKATSIEGKWAIDLEPMVQQAQSLNASNRDIQSMKDTFSNGQLEIDGKRITITIDGINDREVKEYVVSSVEGACMLLSIQSSAKPHKYCLSGNRLEVHDPSTPLTTVYRRM